MIRTIDELPIAGKRLFLRLDLNVPLRGTPDAPEAAQQVANDTRIREALPTIEYALKQGAKLIIASHLGRPEGRDPRFSLEPVAGRLSELLGMDVLLTDDCVGDGVVMITRHLKSSQVILLENLRFHPEEERNDPGFARGLAELGEVYVTDAFGTAHRMHASTYGVAQIMPLRGVGFLIRKELQFLGGLLREPAQPFVVILGGSKVGDKINTIENLYLHTDAVLIGGAMAHAFRIALASAGKGPAFDLPVGARRPKPEEVENARGLIDRAKKHEVKLVLPVDDVDSFDIGPKTIELFTREIAKARTVFWNGPVGVFEKPQYSKGSIAVARAIAECGGIKIVGGGDTVMAVAAAGTTAKMDHISTGGGATLEFLEGNGLPGISVLDTHVKPQEAAQRA